MYTTPLRVLPRLAFELKHVEGAVARILFRIKYVGLYGVCDQYRHKTEGKIYKGNEANSLGDPIPLRMVGALSK
jgi:hypothetical protein